MAQNALHVGENASSNKRGECIRDQVSTKENCVSRCQLSTGIPFRQNHESSGKESGLNKTEEETDDDQSRKVSGHTRQGRDETPNEHDDGDIKRGPLDPVDENVGWDLHQDIADIENAQTCRILAIIHIEIFLEPLETSSGDVIAVQIVHDVDENEETTASIELALQAFLYPCTRGRIGQRRAHRSGLRSLHRLRRRLLEMGGIRAGLGDLVRHDI